MSIMLRLIMRTAYDDCVCIVALQPAELSRDLQRVYKRAHRRRSVLFIKSVQRERNCEANQGTVLIGGLRERLLGPIVF